jgi:molybdopterin-containing oxidoreductase family iron-sulfur binding subunit
MDTPVSTLEDHITGQAYWRSIEEHANSPQLLAQLDDEFQGYDPEEIQSVSRRTFLKLAGASLALAGLTLSGCRRWPEEELAPFATRPEDLIPGVPNYFASMAERGGVAHPMLVASFDGRPIKVESHPHAGYATDIYDQALTLQQYDPDRLRDVIKGKGESPVRSSWTTFEVELKKLVDNAKSVDGGAKFAVLAEPSSSPTLLRLKKKLKDAMPKMAWVTYEPLGMDSSIEGAKKAFGGQAVRTQYDVSKANVIACFDCDFLSTHPSALSNAKGWAVGRKSVDDKQTMNRMYVVEPAMTVTGSAADERLPIKPSRVAHVLTYVGVKLGVSGSAEKLSLTKSETAFADKLVKDLQANKGASIVVAGANQPADVHAYVHAINKALGNRDQTITYSDEPSADDAWQLQAFADLQKKMDAEEIDTLLILGGNPVFDAPADMKFTEALEKVGTSIKLGLYRDETAVDCDWALPAASSFECWGDGRWYDGTLAIQQPLILPLFNGRSAIELLAGVLGDKSLVQPAGYELVRETFKADGLLDGAKFDDHLTDPGYAGDLIGFERSWRRAVHLGFVPGSAFKKVFVDTGSTITLPTLKKASDFEVVYQPSSVFDGRFANSPWLQECPDPITKVVWENPLLLSVPDMKAKKLINGDTINIEASGVPVKEVPVFGQPGQAEGVVVAQVGNGRKKSGNVGTGVGTNFYPMRISGQMGFAPTRLSGKVGYEELAYTSVHHLVMGLSPEMDKTAEWALEKRAGKPGKSGTKGNIIKEGSLGDWLHHPEHVMGHDHGNYRLQLFDPPSIQGDGSFERKHPDGPEVFNEPHAWGMTIDLTSCIGCNACVVACQAENNIPSVGKEQVWRSREMHWLRTDTYFKGDPDKPEKVQVVHQPIACVQCENAPCEQVCPVAATVHDTEGLNTMVYNRCIGTRYCSNNCPYKVRRFNYFDYHAKSPRQDVANPWLNIPDTQQQAAIDKIKRLAFNPDVTVRMRGVMEKCTYCTQRIQRAKIQQKNAYVQANNEGGFTHNPAEKKTVPDGTIVTACQDACPTDCITFGDLNDPESKVSRMQNKNKRAYAVLSELNSRPRTQHMAKIRNPYTSGGKDH